MDPIEWLAWIHGKLFANHPIIGGFCVCTLGAVLAGILYARVLDKYNKEHPAPKAETVAAQGNPPAVTTNQPTAPPPQEKTSTEKKGAKKHAKKQQLIPEQGNSTPSPLSPSPAAAVTVKGTGTWNSTNDTIQSGAGPALSIEEQAHVNSQGLKVNVPLQIDPIELASNLNQFVAEAETLQDSDIQKVQLWTDKVAVYLRDHWDMSHSLKFRYLPNVGMRKNLLVSWSHGDIP